MDLFFSVTKNDQNGAEERAAYLRSATYECVWNATEVLKPSEICIFTESCLLCRYIHSRVLTKQLPFVSGWFDFAAGLF